MTYIIELYRPPWEYAVDYSDVDVASSLIHHVDLYIKQQPEARAFQTVSIHEVVVTATDALESRNAAK